MTIALPVLQNRISPLLDTAVRLLVLTCRDGQESGRREVALPIGPPEVVASRIAELHLDFLLCGAVSEPLLRALTRSRVVVRPHLCGKVDEILHALCQGQLANEEFRMPGCHEVHPPPPVVVGLSPQA